MISRDGFHEIKREREIEQFQCRESSCGCPQPGTLNLSDKLLIVDFYSSRYIKQHLLLRYMFNYYQTSPHLE